MLCWLPWVIPQPVPGRPPAVPQQPPGRLPALFPQPLPLPDSPNHKYLTKVSLEFVGFPHLFKVNCLRYFQTVSSYLVNLPFLSLFVEVTLLSYIFELLLK